MTRIRILALCASMTACALAFPLDGFGPGPDPSPGPDASADRASEPPEGGPDGGCTLERWPERRAAGSPGGGEVSLTLAVSGVEFGADDAGVAPGFDLDGLCTCPGAAACRSTVEGCDRDGGLDNAVTDLIERFSGFQSIFDEEYLNAQISVGNLSLLLQLDGYNGEADDPSVSLAVFASNGHAPGDGGRSVPSFDGSDVWTIDRATTLGGADPAARPRFVDPDAYVSDGVLVGRLSFPLVYMTASGPRAVRIDEGVVSGRLRNDGVWRLERGRLAGRLSTRNLITALGLFPSPFDTTIPLCKSSDAFAALKPQICASADVMRASALDRKDQFCDAFSFGAGVTAVQALEGPVTDTDGGAPCGVDFSDDCLR